MADESHRKLEERIDAGKWLEEYGDALYRFAVSRLGNSPAAEDVVQETLLAALHHRGQFKGASSERTWLIGILKRKIADHLRRVYREKPLADVADEGEWTDRFFDERGNWKIKLNYWPKGPSEELEKQELWSVFARCLSRLPQRLACAFTLRALEEMDGSDVCKVLDVSANNLWVMLHRARLSLARCLEINWFGNNK
jgi:RNA polymerase sigma-70 factor (TIGR02943 family)